MPVPSISCNSALPLPLQALNAQAGKWLTRAKQPITDVEPVFALMLWGLDHGLTNRDPSYMSQLRSSVEFLAFEVEPPRKALDYLVTNPDDPETPQVSSARLRRSESPIDASAYLLNMLDMKMAADSNLDSRWPPVYPAVPGE